MISTTLTKDYSSSQNHIISREDIVVAIVAGIAPIINLKRKNQWK